MKPVMKKIPKSMFFIVTLVIFLFSYLAFFGIQSSKGDIQKSIIMGARDIRFGIDIKGGVDATFEPANSGYKASRDNIDSVKSVLELRLDNLNIADREVFPDYANSRVIVRYPWKATEKDFNPEKAIQELGATALLTFRDPNGKVLLSGSQDIKKATVQFNATAASGSQYVVGLEFTPIGTQKFASATTQLSGKNMGIYMDETQISNPTVNNAITDGKAQIEGSFTNVTAKALSDKINSGSLPFKIISKNYNTISPTLGKNALDVMLMAGILAFSLVCLFMMLYYRVPGFVACIALVGHVAGTILVVTLSQYTLTLPGIAGIILSIGMGVDSNIIIAERIKEELRAGRTLGGSIDSGFTRGWSAILDGNVTMTIVAVILFLMGSGAIKSFGFTLGIGVFFNILMGVIASRALQKSLSKFKFMSHPWLYGGISK
jgi:preprotein translocase subunit SecD